jgi:hypothetical protein
VLVELIRFALDQVSDQPEIRKDHDKKLANQLGPYGSVTVTIEDGGGTSHRVHRVYDPANGSPISEVTFEPSEFFPCHFLSQNEIIRLAESEAEQIKFIDSFFDFHAFRRDIEAARAELLRLDKDVAELIRGRKQIAADEATVATLKAQIAEKDTALISPVFSKYREAQAKKQLLDRNVEAIAGMIQAVAAGKEGLESAPMPEPAPTALAEDPLLRQIADKLREAQSKALEQASVGLDLLGQARNDVVTARAEWMKDFDAIAAEYAEEIKRIGGDAPALNQERARLVARLDRVEKELLAKRQQGERLRPVAERRKQVLDQLEQRQAEYTEARRERCAWFEEKSDRQIRASVEAGSNYDDFCTRLGEMKRGSYLTGAEIEMIARGIAPRQFVSAILNYDHTRQDSHLHPIHSATGVPLEKVRVLADFLVGEQEYEQLLAIAYTATPTDRPQIQIPAARWDLRPTRGALDGAKSHGIPRYDPL